MSIYIAVLFLVFISIFINYDSSKKRKKLFLITSFFILTVIAMLRSWEVGVDTEQYYRNFGYITYLDWSQSDVLRYEIGFFALCKVLSYFSNDPYILIMVSSLIIIPSIGRFIYKYSENVALSTFLYITLNAYFFNMTGMRQSLAIVFIVYGFDYLVEEKYIRYFIFIVIASLFHSSALFLISLIFIRKMAYTRNSYIKTIFIIGICFVFYKYLFRIAVLILGKYAGYEESVFGGSNYLGSLFQFLIGMIFYSVCHYLYFIRTQNKSVNSKINMMALRLFSLAICFQALAMKMNILGRMVPYFWIFGILAIPNTIFNCKIKRRKEWILCIITLSFVYWFIIAKFRPEWHGVIPYAPFFNK